MNAATLEGRALLDQVHSELEGPRVDDAMDHLVMGLRTLREKVPSLDWEAFCRTECVSHPVRFKVHQDPLTERAFFKPRGYPGDAVLLDLFYGAEGVQPYIDDATELGQKIYRYTSSATAARALRRRKEILATFIDRVSDSTEPACIMTLGCGHLREAELSAAFKHRRLGRFLAVDRDPDSLRVVREKFGPLGVETAESTVNELIEIAHESGSSSPPRAIS